MSILRLCGVAICAVVLSLLIKKENEEFSRASSVLSSVILLAAAIAAMSPVISFLFEQAGSLETDQFASYAMIMLKALGIALIVQTSADICRDSGESAVANRLETVGKAEIILLTLPLIKQLFAFAADLV